MHSRDNGYDLSNFQTIKFSQFVVGIEPSPPFDLEGISLEIISWISWKPKVETDSLSFSLSSCLSNGWWWIAFRYWESVSICWTSDRTFCTEYHRISRKMNFEILSPYPGLRQSRDKFAAQDFTLNVDVMWMRFPETRDPFPSWTRTNWHHPTSCKKYVTTTQQCPA